MEPGQAGESGMTNEELATWEFRNALYLLGCLAAGFVTMILVA